MKNLVLIMRADAQQRLADVLRTLPGVSGFTFTHAEGHGPLASRDPSVSARDLVVGYTPHVRVDLLLDDADIAPLLEALAVTDFGVHGHCLYWVLPVLDHGRL
jgi:nitrogen regulatory protein P-II 1